MVDSGGTFASESAPPHPHLLLAELARLEPQAAANLLADEPAPVILEILTALPTARVAALLPRFGSAERLAILKSATAEQREKWLYNERYPKGTVGRLMEPAVALFPPDLTVAQAVERLRDMAKQAFISYGYVVDEQGRLIGALVMRELLLAESR